MSASTVTDKVVNVVFAGLGGQGVIRASDVLAGAAFAAGFDVKKSEIHGMSQRGGSVTSDVRFGRRVLSPMVPAGAADFLVVLAPDQVDVNRPLLKPGGVLVPPELVADAELPSKRSLNVVLLGALSRFLDIGDEHWAAAIAANLPEKASDANAKAFALGRERAAILKG